jgi:hypothetical protein
MAINHADGTMFTSMVFCPIAAGVGAAHAGAGWLTFFFIPVGLAVGVGIFRFCRQPVYSVTGLGMSLARKMPKGWIQQVVCLPFFLLYMILPLGIVWGAVFGLWAGSIWLVRHAL